jgi:hypothetical protein
MREILLKESINNQEDEALREIDLISCSKEELERLIDEYGINIDDYMHPLNPKDIIDNYPRIEESVK